MRKFRTRAEAEEFFDSLNMQTVRSMFVDLIFELQSAEQPRRIPITEEQLSAYFKVIGRKDDGTEERRGRPKKEA